MHRDIIQKVPLFQHCSPGFIHSLVSYLQPQIYSPRDVLVREGDVGHEMYFIRKGKGVCLLCALQFLPSLCLPFLPSFLPSFPLPSTFALTLM